MYSTTADVAATNSIACMRIPTMVIRAMPTTSAGTAGARVPPPARGPTMAWLLRGALRGAALGLGWGLAARIWMRAISPEPEFSWAGTLLILGFATWLGVGCGILAAARADGRRRGWALVGLPGLLLFAGPGMLFLPAFAFGGLAISARAVGWRVLGALAVIGPVYLTWRLTAEDSFSDDGSVLFAVAGFAMLSVGLASAGAAIWTRGGPTSVPLWAPTRSQEVDGPLPSGHKPSAPVGAATTGGPPTASP